MIRTGKLCKHCKNQCKDLGTDAEPIEIECPACEGTGCSNCKEGFVTVLGCPNDYCRSVSGSIRFFELFDKGVLPIAGGALDQSSSFMDAERVFRADEFALRSE